MHDYPHLSNFKSINNSDYGKGSNKYALSVITNIYGHKDHQYSRNNIKKYP